MSGERLLLLRNADVYAPEPLGLCDLLIGGGKLLWCGRELAAHWVHTVAGDVIDLEGRRLLPGLVDSHAHLTGGGGEAGAHTRVPALPAEVCPPRASVQSLGPPRLRRHGRPNRAEAPAFRALRRGRRFP